MDEDEEVLQGGVANAGAVVRLGTHVLRPSNEHSASILTFLSELEVAGFQGAPIPVGLQPDGRERLDFIPGDVAIPPFPDWAQTDTALASVAVLIRSLHDASELVDTKAMTWSSEMADPEGGPEGGTVVCHNDVCLENVVFRDGHAVALLDFDFAAPGRRTFDLAAFARMCVPVDDDINSTKQGWHASDRPGRLRVVCDAYGLDAEGRSEVLSCLDESIARGGEFVRRRAEAGEPGFVKMWAEIGGMERFDRRRRWWAEARPSFEAALYKLPRTHETARQRGRHAGYRSEQPTNNGRPMANWELAGTARRDFADMVAPLSTEQLAQPTLCADWDARGVLAHLVMFVELGAFSFFGTIAKHRFDFDKAWIAAAAQRKERPTEDLLETLRDGATKSAPLPGFPEGITVADVAIHTQDVRRPLGLAGALAPEVLRGALDFLTTAKQAKNLVDLPSLDGIRLAASDLDWSHGEGAEVTGPAEAIMMALARRPVLDELAGEGVARLR